MSDELLTFTRGSPTQTVSIIIRNDNTVEDSENFVATLSVNADLYSGVRLEPDTANIHILDPNGKTIRNLKCVVAPKTVYMILCCFMI